jgi:hypothetical protein
MSGRQMSRICMKINGGLGNQLFQAALGIKLAHARNVPLAFDATAYVADEPLRIYQLDRFKIDAKLLTANELSSMRPLAVRLPKPLYRRAHLFPFLKGKAYIKERQWRFDPSILDVAAPAYLDGYWQTEKYFSTVIDRVREQFRLTDPITSSRQKIRNILLQKNSVSVHVRRGDYVASPSTLALYGTCSPEWYERAMAAVAEALGAPHFFVFSDDPEWARINLPARWPRHFIDPNHDGRDFEDMHLMSQCSHHIIANSTFSWWGAWLNPHRNKIVVAPARWFASSPLDTQDMVPAEWVRM